MFKVFQLKLSTPVHVVEELFELVEVVEVVTEMPRSFSISIQSDLACWFDPRPLTVPAF